LSFVDGALNLPETICSSLMPSLSTFSLGPRYPNPATTERFSVDSVFVHYRKLVARCNNEYSRNCSLCADGCRSFLSVARITTGHLQRTMRDRVRPCVAAFKPRTDLFVATAWFYVIDAVKQSTVSPHSSCRKPHVSLSVMPRGSNPSCRSAGRLSKLVN